MNKKSEIFATLPSYIAWLNTLTVILLCPNQYNTTNLLLKRDPFYYFAKCGGQSGPPNNSTRCYLIVGANLTHKPASSYPAHARIPTGHIPRTTPSHSLNSVVGIIYNSEHYRQSLVSPFSFYVLILFDVFSAVLCHLFFELVGWRHVTILFIALVSFS